MNNHTYIVAELSANHGHKLENALASVRAAKAAGADAIKIQTYTADTITLYSDKPDFQVNFGTLWDGMTLHQLYQTAYTPWEWHQAIFDEAKKVGIDCFSTPFDKTAVDLLEELGNPIYKIASFEITDIPLIEYAASKHKPMVISAGIATPDDIQLALDACKRVGNEDVTLLHCFRISGSDGVGESSYNDGYGSALWCTCRIVGPYDGCGCGDSCGGAWRDDDRETFHS